MTTFSLLAALVLLVLPACAGSERRSLPLTEPEKLVPVLIEVAHADSRGFYYYRLESPNYASLYRFLYLQAATASRTTIDPPALCELMELSGGEGRELASALWALDPSWEPNDYWIRLPQVDQYSPHLYEEHCGVVRYGSREVFGCPIRGSASGAQSPEANKIAWFLQRLDRTRERNTAEANEDQCKEEAAAALRNLSARFPDNLVLRVYRGPKQKFPELNRPLNVGERLKEWTAAALVNAELVGNPIAHTDPLIRKHAVEWYLQVWPEHEARSALLKALRDPEADIRALGATGLASVMEPDDIEAIRAVRQLLVTDKDHPMVRESLVDTLRSRGLLSDPGIEAH